MNPLPTLEQLGVQYVRYIILCSNTLQEAAARLGLPVTTFYRFRLKHNLPGPLPKPLTIPFEEFLKSLGQ